MNSRLKETKLLQKHSCLLSGRPLVLSSRRLLRTGISAQRREHGTVGGSIELPGIINITMKGRRDVIIGGGGLLQKTTLPSIK